MALRNGVLVFTNRLEGWVYSSNGSVYVLERLGIYPGGLGIYY